jgi:putative hydrolase of the HAD superfamily
MRMAIKAVLFDFFDTIFLLQQDKINYERRLKRIHAFLAQKSIDVPYDVFKRIYFQVRDEVVSKSQLTLEEPHFNVRVSKILHILGYSYDVYDPVVTGATAAFCKGLMQHVVLDPEARNILQHLHSEYKLGLVSKFAIPECGHQLLEKHKIKDLFEVIIFSGDVNMRKPRPEIFQMALEALGVKPAQAVFVGDRYDLDVYGPKSIGMGAIQIIRKPTAEKMMNPQGIIMHLSELPRIMACSGKG